MKKDLICLVGVIVLGANACVHHPPLTVDPPQDTVCREIDVDRSFEEEQACPEWRKIALATDPNAGCPAPASFGGQSWTVEPLFQQSPPSSLPPVLRPFCLYETLADNVEILAGLNANLQSLVTQGRLERVDSSCAAIATAAPSKLSSDSWQLLQDHFLEQAGQMTTVALAGDEPSVQLALIDTQPGSLNKPGNSEHGYTLGHLAQRLICAGQPLGASECAVEITSHLALPIVSFDRDSYQGTEIDTGLGGFYGTVDHLAETIWEVVETWRTTAEQQHLVLNLSVAWDGARFGGLERRVENMPVPIQALHRVLEVASCRGVLAVAAAGNRKGGFDEEEGPLLPGGWERRDAPARSSCAKIDGLDTARSKAHSHREPLVYAAGGVRTGGSPLANARAGGEPPRVAYGDHAVVATAAGDGPTGILTGSSVATAVVSATAAAAWHLQPALKRPELMTLLYRSGQELGRVADFYHGSQAAPEVRRIALCPALASACRGSNRCAGGPFECPEIRTDRLRLSSAPLGCQTADLADATRIDTTTIDQGLGQAALCTAREIRFDSRKGPPTDPCPGRQYFGVTARPWTHPQPGTNPCSGCSSDPDTAVQTGRNRLGTPSFHTLHIEIDPNWQAGTLREAFLDIGDLSFALNLKELDPGDCATIEGIDSSLFEPPDGGLDPPVVLRFRVEPEHGEPVASVEVPIFVAR